MTEAVREVETAPSAERIGVVVIHGVGEAEAGWTNMFLLPELQARAPELQIEDHSEVYFLPDRARTRSGSTFPTFVRRTSVGEHRRVAFAELGWSDLSRVGRGLFSTTFAVLKVFFEAPPVMALAALKAHKYGLDRVLRFLILTTIWLFKWPVVGLNFTAFGCGFAMVAVDRTIGREKLAAWVGYPNHPMETVIIPALVLLIIGGIWVARERVHKDIYLTDLSLSTALSSLVVLIGIVLNMHLAFWPLASTIDQYLPMALSVILGAWKLWGATILAAIGLIFVMALLRLWQGDPIRPPDSRQSQDEPPRRDRLPLHRPATALWLSIIQAVGWNLVIPPAGFLLSIALLESCVTPTCIENLDRQALLGPLWFSFAGLLIIVVLLGILTLVRTRIAHGKASPRPRKTQSPDQAPFAADDPQPSLFEGMAARMPRLIISPIFFVFSFSATVIDIVAAWFKLYQDILGVLVVSTSAVIVSFMTVWLYFLNQLARAAYGVLHIARDLIDHQYAPRWDFIRWVLPKGKVIDSPWPRRKRIHERLDVMMDTVIGKEKLDKLIFVTHSQGTVIMFDYLKGTGSDDLLNTIPEIHIVTLGSPLSHIYQFYFDEYGSNKVSVADLHPNVKSWVNIWRVDDPIGNRIDMVEDDRFVQNMPIGKGGHTTYWKSDEVCAAILRFFEEPSLRPPPKAGA